ncbi:MAG TPA: GYD domain-containing protein [Thermoleophilia bacterium]|nr:GYD domain-containing protein [Thermoleophilia bacterium]
MARYLIQGTYTAEGAKGLLAKGGTARRAAVEETLKGLGGSVESFYFAFGDTDFYVVADVPDAVTAAAVVLTVSGAGGVRANTTVLLTPEEIDQATAKKVGYRPPGA